MFDPRELKAEHVVSAIEEYRATRPKHHPARSAFLLVEGEENPLPAKKIICLAFRCATGELPRSEQLTGGRASVHLLLNLGFNAVYEKRQNPSNRNKVKNARREAFRRLLELQFGSIKIEERFDALRVPDISKRNSLAQELASVLSAIERVRQMPVQGKYNHRLVIEFDERQHLRNGRHEPRMISHLKASICWRDFRNRRQTRSGENRTRSTTGRPHL
ncbi:hypothetical protein BH20VER3_BH20VER3_16280 [soil metagenome]